MSSAGSATGTGLRGSVGASLLRSVANMSHPKPPMRATTAAVPNKAKSDRCSSYAHGQGRRLRGVQCDGVPPSTYPHPTGSKNSG